MKHSRRPFPVLQCCQCVNASLFQFRDRDARSAGVGEDRLARTSRKETTARTREPCRRLLSARPPCRCGFAPGIRRGSWATQDGTAGRRSCLNVVFRALYVAEENYEVRTRKTHTGLGGNAILRFSSGKLGLYQKSRRGGAPSHHRSPTHDIGFPSLPVS